MENTAEVHTVHLGFPVTYSTLYQKSDCWIWRLDNNHSAWSPIKDDNQQWVQVSSIKPQKWIAVITQGRPNWNQWITEYRVSWSMNGINWAFVDGGKVFPGNSDKNGKVRNNFSQAVTARAIRIHPTKWQGHISMRFDAVFIST